MIRGPVLPMVLAVLTFGAAQQVAAATCRDDLVAVSSTVERTRAELKDAAATAKCVAYRKHVAALTQVRDVFARCDTGTDKAKNAAQVGATIADMTKQMQASCKK